MTQNRGVSVSTILEQRHEEKHGDKYKGAIKYKGDLIAQYHNPKIFIDDLYGENQTKQFTSVMIIGSPGTGKSSLHEFISHGIHTKNPNYYPMHLKRRDLLKLDDTLNNAPRGRDLILNFHDVTGVFKDVASPQQKAKIISTLTEARHPNFVKTDRKVIVLVNVHYENSMEKIWRSQGSWKIYTDMNADESQVFNGKTHNRYENKVDIFQRTVLSQFRKKEFTVSLTNKTDRTYVTGGIIQDNEKSQLFGKVGTFRFIMVYDTIDVRFYLIPREYCSQCSQDGNTLAKVEASPDEIHQLMFKYYGKDGTQGLKMALLNSGISHQYPNKPVYAYNVALEMLQFFNVNKDALGTWLRDRAKITDKRLYTPRRKRVDFFNDLKEIRAKNVSPLGNLTFTPSLADKIDLDL